MWGIRPISPSLSFRKEGRQVLGKRERSVGEDYPRRKEESVKPLRSLRFINSLFILRVSRLDRDVTEEVMETAKVTVLQFRFSSSDVKFCTYILISIILIFL